MKNPHLFETLCHSDGANEFSTNITLLDLFAGMAMQGFMSHETSMKAAINAAKMSSVTEETSLAIMSYRVAQAMLEERENIPKGESNA